LGAPKLKKPVKAGPKPSAKQRPAAGLKPSAAAAAVSKPVVAPAAGARAAAAKPAGVKAAAPAAPVREAVGIRRHPLPASSISFVGPGAAATDVDSEEGAEAGSLLAGPRNVQPYIAKRGEAYMNKEQLDHFRSILLSWKQDLMVEVDRTVSHMKDEAANFPDPNDRATQEEEFSLELRTRDRERKLIRKIEEALKRIDDGSYGYCLETGEEIGIKRLEARPVATLSIEAQERRERREKQYGDRDDRYR
jgi:DnaK suppressor protein